MPIKEPPHRHNGGPLSDDMAEKLWGHIRAIEVIEEGEQDLRDDKKARRELAKADGIDVNIMAAIIKRRKNGHGETMAADQLTRIYEEALQDQGALPLEQTRITPTPRRDPDDIAQELHGQPLPPEPGEEQQEDPAARLDRLAREAGGTITISGGGQSVTFGERPALFD